MKLKTYAPQDAVDEVLRRLDDVPVKDATGQAIIDLRKAFYKPWLTWLRDNIHDPQNVARAAMDTCAILLAETMRNATCCEADQEMSGAFLDLCWKEIRSRALEYSAQETDMAVRKHDA